MRLILDVTSLHYGGIMFFDHPCPSASHLTIESSSYVHVQLQIHLVVNNTFSLFLFGINTLRLII